MKPTTKINVNNICSIDPKRVGEYSPLEFETVQYPSKNIAIRKIGRPLDVCTIFIEMNNGKTYVKEFKTEAELISFELEITERPKNLSNFIEI